jgi:hypothetical protein
MAEEGGIRTPGTIQDLQGEIVRGTGSLFDLIIAAKFDGEFLRLRFGSIRGAERAQSSHCLAQMTGCVARNEQ